MDFGTLGVRRVGIVVLLGGRADRRRRRRVGLGVILRVAGRCGRGGLRGLLASISLLGDECESTHGTLGSSDGRLNSGGSRLVQPGTGTGDEHSRGRQELQESHGVATVLELAKV